MQGADGLVAGLIRVVLTATANQDSSSGGELQLTISGAVIFLAGVWTLRYWQQFWDGQFWRREIVDRRMRHFSKVMGVRWERAFYSIWPVVSVSILLLGAFVLLGQLLPSPNASAPDHPLFVAVGVAWFVSGGLVITILLFNRPRSLVPPHARGFYGLWGDHFRMGWRRFRARRQARY